jgi:ribosomal protein S18 acetylase RimI-like enzyme
MESSRTLVNVETVATSIVEGHQRDAALRTLVAAFENDPLERWMYPTSRQYEQCFPRFLMALGGRAFEAGTAWGTSDMSAVALWLPPGMDPDDEGISAVLTETASPDKHPDLLMLADEIARFPPDYPHWYLAWFGVETATQGVGVGSGLMDVCLKVVDADHHPAYLESSNPRNVPFYERHGFDVIGRTQVGSSPPLTFMLRSGR